MVADAGKDNWESHQEDQTNRSHDDESAEVDAEIVEETSTQELVHVQEEVLEEKKSIEVTTETNEPADNTVEKVNGQESSPENLNLTKSAEEVTTGEVHTESSPQIAQSRLSEDGTEEKNNGDSITMETSKLVEEVRGVSTTYELVQERDTKVSEAESEEKNNTEPTTEEASILPDKLVEEPSILEPVQERETQASKDAMEEKRNADSKPEEKSKPVDEVDEKTITQESTQESPNREVPAKDKYTESSAEEFRESESKLSECETENQISAQLTMEEKSNQLDDIVKETETGESSTEEVKESGIKPLEDVPKEQNNAESKTEGTPKPDEDIQEQSTQDTQESVQLNESNPSENVPQENNKNKSTTQDTPNVDVAVQKSNTQQQTETKPPEEHNNTASEEVHAIQIKSSEDGTEEKGNIDITTEETRKPVDGIIEASDTQNSELFEKCEATSLEGKTEEQNNVDLTSEGTPKLLDQIVEKPSAQESGLLEESKIKTSENLLKDKNNIEPTTEQISKPANILVQESTTQELVQVKECEAKPSEDLLEEQHNTQLITDKTSAAEFLEEPRTSEEVEKMPKPVNEFADQIFMEPDTHESVVVKGNQTKPSEEQTQEMSNTESTTEETQKLIDEVVEPSTLEIVQVMKNQTKPSEDVPEENCIADIIIDEISKPVDKIDDEVFEEPCTKELVDVKESETRHLADTSHQDKNVEPTAGAESIAAETIIPVDEVIEEKNSHKSMQMKESKTMSSEDINEVDEHLPESKTLEAVEIKEIKTQPPEGGNEGITDPDLTMEDPSKSADDAVSNVVEKPSTQQSASMTESQMEPSADLTKEINNTESAMEETTYPVHEDYDEPRSQESVEVKERETLTEELSKSNEDAFEDKAESKSAETLKSVDDIVEELNTQEVTLEESEIKPSDDVPNGNNNAESITEKTTKPIGDVNEKHESVQIEESAIPTEDLLEEKNTADSTIRKEPQPEHEVFEEDATQKVVQVEESETQLSDSKTEESSAQESQPVEESEIKISDLPEEKTNTQSEIEQTSEPANELVKEPEISAEIVQTPENETKPSEPEHIPDKQHIQQTTEDTPKPVTDIVEEPRTIEESTDEENETKHLEDGQQGATTHSAMEQISEPANELVQEPEISAEIVQTPESETNPSEHISVEQHITQTTTEDTPKPVTDIVEESRTIKESIEEESETKHLEDGQQGATTHSTMEQISEPANELVQEPEISAEIVQTPESETKPSEPEHIHDEQHITQTTTEDTPKKVTDIVEESRTIKESIEESETKHLEDGQQGVTTQSAMEQISEPANELVQEPEISAEIVQTPESETNPSEHISVEQHITQTTTEDTPKPVTDIVEESRTIKESIEEESETKHLEDGQQGATTHSATEQISEPANELVQEPEISAEIVQTPESETKPSEPEHIHDEQHITQTTTEDTPKKVTDIVEESRTIKESIEESETKHLEDGQQGVTTQSAMEQISEPANELVQEPEISAEIVQTPESETNPSEHISVEQHITQTTTEDTPKPVTDIVEESRTIKESIEEENETKHLEDGQQGATTHSAMEQISEPANELVQEPEISAEIVQTPESETKPSEPEHIHDEQHITQTTDEETPKPVTDIVEEPRTIEESTDEENETKHLEDGQHITITQSAMEQISEPANELVQELEISTEIMQTPESETNPSENIPVEQHIAQTTNKETPKPVTDIVEELRTIKGSTEKGDETKHLEDGQQKALITIEEDNDGVDKEIGTQEVKAEENEKKSSNDVPNGNNNAESITEEAPKPVDVNEKHESMQIKESETISSEDLLEEKNTADSTIQKGPQLADEVFEEPTTQKVVQVEETDTQLFDSKTVESSAQESQPVEESEIKISEDLPEEKTNTQSATEQISEPANELVQEPEISAEIVQTPENETKPSEHISDEQHIAQTTVETPKPVTDIVEELRALEEEREAKHPEDGTEEQKQATLIIERDNDVKELSTQEVTVEKSGVKPSNGKNNAESITKETCKPVGDVTEEQSTHESVQIKESGTIPSEDLLEENNTAESTIEKGPHPVDEVFEEPSTQEEAALVVNKVFKEPNTEESILVESTTQVSNAETTIEEATEPEDVVIQKSHSHEVLKESEDATEEMNSTESTTAVSEAATEPSAEAVVKGAESEPMSSQDGIEEKNITEKTTAETLNPVDSITEKSCAQEPTESRESNSVSDGNLENVLDAKSVPESTKSSAKPAQFISEEMSTPESSDDEVTRARDDKVECQTTPESSEDEGIHLNEEVIAPNDKDTTDENSRKTETTSDTEETATTVKGIPIEGKVEAEQTATEEVNANHAAEDDTTNDMREQVVAEQTVE